MMIHSKYVCTVYWQDVFMGSKQTFGDAIERYSLL